MTVLTSANNPYKKLSNAYSLFASSNDPSMRNVYESYLMRQKEREEKLEKERQEQIYRMYLESRISGSFLKDFYANRY